MKEIVLPISWKEIGILLILSAWLAPITYAVYLWWEGVNEWYLSLIFLIFALAFLPMYHDQVNWGFSMRLKDND